MIGEGMFVAGDLNYKGLIWLRHVLRSFLTSCPEHWALHIVAPCMIAIVSARTFEPHCLHGLPLI
jgi:hypothetical protein